MLVLNIFLTLCTLYGTYYYIFRDGSLDVKATVAFIFVLTGAINLVYGILKRKKPYKFPFFAVMGLVFSMAGDIAISKSFIAGAVMFALGHIFYFAAHTSLCPFSAKDLIYIGLLFVPSALFMSLSPIFDFSPDFLFYVCAAYALIISFMTGKALSNLVRKPSAVTLYAALGSLLFLFSDFMLLIWFFADSSKLFSALCMAAYFPAQSVLAHSVYRYNKT